ncbi:MAG TPA: ABC transporter substrate-binding protein [Spirochaetia bacterium]|nr:ABC transporter substrate-binding protein [Spirochaetia bacterium]
MKRLALVLAALFIAAAGTWAQESVNAYASCDEPLAKQLFTKFTQETNIKVNFVRLSGGEAISRMEAERENPQASIWVGGVGLDHISGKLKGLTTPYRSRMAETIPAKFRDPENYWTGLYIGPLTFFTNNARAKALGLTPPTSWADLLKPEYKGYIRVSNPNTSGTAYNIITTLRYIYNGDENAAFDYLKKLDANIDQYTRSGAAYAASVAIGEIPIGIGYAHDQVKMLNQGVDATITAPKEGSGYELAAMSLIKGGKDAVNAKKLYDWILGKSSQEIFATYYVLLVAPGAPRDPHALPLTSVNALVQDLQWDGANKDRLVKRWNDEIGSHR